jgi:hypothetical protein
MSQYYARHSPNDRAPVRVLCLIRDVYSQLGMGFVRDTDPGEAKRNESAYP